VGYDLLMIFVSHRLGKTEQKAVANRFQLRAAVFWCLLLEI
jgi:hypothetical protein